jgi:hypothetical protein
MAWLRDSKRHPDNSKQQAWGVFGQDNAVWERQCENCRTRDPLRSAREAKAVSSARLTRARLPFLADWLKRMPHNGYPVAEPLVRVSMRERKPNAQCNAFVLFATRPVALQISQ